jgi:undecaprenyl-diphosphatase
MEQHILEIINREWTSPGLDFFMLLISTSAMWRIPLGIAFGGALLFGCFRTRAAVVCGVLAVTMSDGVVCNSVKHLVGRPRPFQMLADVRLLSFQSLRFSALAQPLKIKMSRPEEGEITGRSFPSAHTANNFCAAVVLAYFFRFGWLYFFPAACIGYSRLYLGVHWPSDVITSVFIGVGWGLLWLVACEWLWKKIGPRALPRLFEKHPRLAPGAAS